MTPPPKDLRAAAADWTGLALDEIDQIAATAGLRYKVYEIPKKSGGVREIAQPAREVKLLQRFLNETLWSVLPVHDAATAYKPGASIRDNAERHAGCAAILKLDFQSFFPSFKSDDVDRFLATAAPTMTEADRTFAVRVSTRLKHRGEPFLSIGAPSSPLITNAMMAAFDAAVTDGLPPGAVYTRYADDLTLSAADMETLQAEEGRVGAIVAAHDTPPLRLKPSKRALIRTGRRRSVTGVVLPDAGGLSLGRARKRRISATVHHLLTGRLDAEAAKKLQGALAFVHAVEPAFLDRLRAKYGADGVASALSGRGPRAPGGGAPPPTPAPPSASAQPPKRRFLGFFNRRRKDEG